MGILIILPITIDSHSYFYHPGNLINIEDNNDDAYVWETQLDDLLEADGDAPYVDDLSCSQSSQMMDSMRVETGK